MDAHNRRHTARSGGKDSIPDAWRLSRRGRGRDTWRKTERSRSKALVDALAAEQAAEKAETRAVAFYDVDTKKMSTRGFTPHLRQELRDSRTLIACFRRSDSRAPEKNSRRKKNKGRQGGGGGGKGERTLVNIPLESSFRP